MIRESDSSAYSQTCHWAQMHVFKVDGSPACIVACSERALKNIGFVDHPKSREEVLEMEKCKGNRCLACVLVCPIGNRKKSVKVEKQ